MTLDVVFTTNPENERELNELESAAQSQYYYYLLGGDEAYLQAYYEKNSVPALDDFSRSVKANIESAPAVVAINQLMSDVVDDAALGFVRSWDFLQKNPLVKAARPYIGKAFLTNSVGVSFSIAYTMYVDSIENPDGTLSNKVDLIIKSTVANSVGAAIGYAFGAETTAITTAVLAPEIGPLALPVGVGTGVFYGAVVGILTASIIETTIDNTFEDGSITRWVGVEDDINNFADYVSDNVEEFSGYFDSLKDGLLNVADALPVFVTLFDVARAIFPVFTPRFDPLLLDLDGDGIETVGVDSEKYFDNNKDGFAENTGWVGYDDGILAIDKNNDGLISDGSEVFGDQYLKSNQTLPFAA